MTIVPIFCSFFASCNHSFRQKEETMNNETMIATALHVLYLRLQTLRDLEPLEAVEADLATYYQDTLEEADAALAQVETEIDQLKTELEYHHQRFQEVQKQQSKERKE